jgi:hypothetical protein
MIGTGSNPSAGSLQSPEARPRVLDTTNFFAASIVRAKGFIQSGLTRPM